MRPSTTALACDHDIGREHPAIELSTDHDLARDNVAFHLPVRGDDQP